LFDDTNQLPSPSTAPSNNPFPLIDPTPYATGLQPQYTSFPQVQQQYTSFNPYQQQAQEAAQADFLRQQQLFLLQQQQAQQQQQQQEEYIRQQQLLQMQQQQHQQNLFAPQQPLQVQPTGFGTNNPFAPSPSPSFSPTSQTQQRGPSPSFNLPSTYEIHSPSHLSSLSSSPAPSHTPSTQGRSQGQKPFVVKTKDEENEALAALFAEREGGQDTFGNIGALRYGYTDAGKSILSTQKTGSSHNPFAQQQQQQHNEKPFFDI